MLRDFLFLDTKAVSNYVAQVEGYAVDGPIDQTETGKKDRGGKIGATLGPIGAEGTISSGSSFEVKQKLAITPEAQFEQLHKYLDSQGAPGQGIQQLDAFDEQIWNQLQRGEILEVEATIQVPQSFLITQTGQALSQFMELGEALGKDPTADPQLAEAAKAFKSFSKMAEDKPIPLLFETTSTPEFKFLTELPKQFLRCDLSDLQGEATIFGKVRRIIRKGEQRNVFSTFPAFTGLLPNLNPNQMQQAQRQLAEQGLADTIEGPAIILTTVAVYQ